MKKTILLTLLVLGIFSASAQETARKTQFNLSSGVALSGYDPVSYFKGYPISGSDEWSYTYKQVTYHFYSEANKELFKKNPTKYEPQYGGWCAYAMGKKGEKVEVNPTTYKIIDHKLYLFYNSYGNNTLKDWNKNETVLKSNADKKWMKFYKI